MRPTRIRDYFMRELMNKNLILRFAAFIVAVITFSACSSDDNDDEVVNESKVYGTYAGTYVEKNRTFSEGGIAEFISDPVPARLFIKKSQSQTIVLLLNENGKTISDKAYEYTFIGKEESFPVEWKVKDENSSWKVYIDDVNVKFESYEKIQEADNKETTIVFEGVKQNIIKQQS